MNTYLYAPKDDDKHRACWRELEEADQLSHLIHQATSRGVFFIYAITPGWWRECTCDLELSHFCHPLSLSFLFSSPPPPPSPSLPLPSSLPLSPSLPLLLSRLFFVIECVNGDDLMIHMQCHRRLPEEHARFYSAEISCALNYLHERGGDQ